MNQSDEKIINKLFEGTCTESDLQYLIQKLEQDLPFKKEVLQQIQTHALLEANLQQDTHGAKIHKSIMSLNSDPSASISQRIMPLLKAKPKKKSSPFKVFLPMAALLCLTFALWWVYHQPTGVIEPSNMTITNFDQTTRKIPKEEDVLYTLKTTETADYRSETGIQLKILPQSKFHVSQNQFHLHEGVLFADIQKRKNLKPLEFITGSQKTIITGTQFSLHYKKRNDKWDYLLQLTEGNITYHNASQTIHVKQNEYLYFNEDDNSLRYGKLKDITPERFEGNILYASPKKYHWMPFFWSSWTQGRVNISDTQKNIVLIGEPKETTYITSEAKEVGFYSISYDINLTYILNYGSAEVGLRCYHNGQYAYGSIGRLIREGSKVKVENIQFKNQKETTISHEEISVNQPIVRIKGNIYNQFDGKPITSENRSSAIQKYLSNKQTDANLIKDVVFEIFVKAGDNSNIRVNIDSIKITRQ